MASDLAAADAITKIGYGDIHDQLNDRVVALRMVEAGSKHIKDGNVEAQFATRMGRSKGIGARSENGNLPTAGKAKDARASIFLKYQYGRIQGTGQVFKQVSNNSQGFVDWMQREMSDIVESLDRDLNRQVYGDGTGTMALVATASAAGDTAIVLDDVHFLEVDDYIDILTAATLANNPPTAANSANPVKITAINTATNTITVTPAVTAIAAVGSAVVRADADGTARENNWKKEWEGLGLIIGTGTLHAINPANFPRWLPGYTEATVGTLAELDITHLAQGIHQQGGKVSDFLTTYGVVNAYWSALQGLRRYDGSEKLKGGATTPVFQSVFGDIPITPDWSCPTGSLYAIDKGQLYLHQLDKWAWMDKDGSMWSRVPNKDAYSATMFQYSNIGTYRRNTHGKLTGITES